MTDGACVGPRATVVITTHDRPELVRRAIASVLVQTLADLEVVVVDDGSQPPFAAEVEDRRVRVIRNDAPGGVGRARNAGLAAARGEWITFLDDDDRLDPEMLERSLAAADRSSLPGPVAVNPAVGVLGEGGGVAETLVPPDGLARGEDYFLERRGAAGRAANSLVVPTAVLRAIGGFDEQLVVFEHHDLGLRLNAVASIQGVADPLYFMSTHGDARLSKRYDAIPSAMERTLRRHRDAFARHRNAHARFVGAIGYAHLDAGHWLPAIRWSVRAVVLDPRDRRVWFFLAAALAGPAALRLDRRLRPREVTVSLGELTMRRTRKYARRAVDFPRALVAAPLASVTRRALPRRVPAAVRERTRSVLVCCVYRARNAAIVAPLVDEAVANGWDVRLWALDHTSPGLAAHTVGEGGGAKFPLLNGLVAGFDLDRLDWVVIADDDFAFAPGSLSDLIAVSEVAGLDLVQPAHTELSHRENAIGTRAPLSIARRTTFVEIGPVFAVGRPWIGRVLPFPPDHTMGWGLELEWFDLEAQGAHLGVIDAVPIRHLQPVGRGYAKTEQLERLRALLAARGLDSIGAVQTVRGTWRPWRTRPPWAGDGADHH